MYYQTNYLLSAALIFALVTYMHPQDMALGVVTMVSVKGEDTRRYRLELLNRS